MANQVGARAHNRVVKAGIRRAEELEGRLVDILEPILADVGKTAAKRFRAKVTDHMTASALQADRDRIAVLGRDGVRAIFPSLLLAAGTDVSSNSTMIAVKPIPDEAEALAKVDGVDPDSLHVTLAYLGEYDGDLDELADVLTDVALSHAPLSGRVGGVGSFDDNGNGYPAILLPSVPGLIELRVAVTEALVEAGFDYGREHGYLPHLTVSYEDSEMVFPADGMGQELHFDDLWVVRGDTDVRRVPLDGVAPLTAAGEPTPWTSPAADEIIDVEALIKTLRGKTDPVRKAVVESVMKPSLDQAGIAFDVTNPLAAKVLAQSASQITEIADTTRLNVMRIIKAAHDDGLSIPATAKAIQAGMADASVARATLIARTELVGAVNGGSLAATQIVSEETGDAYDKVWLTAPGAQYPRHELYEGLDGQTTSLDGLFQVGEDELQFPGDPSGSPDEVCNCRCTMVYEDRVGNETETVDSEA